MLSRIWIVQGNFDDHILWLKSEVNLNYPFYFVIVYARRTPRGPYIIGCHRFTRSTHVQREVVTLLNPRLHHRVQFCISFTCMMYSVVCIQISDIQAGETWFWRMVHEFLISIAHECSDIIFPERRLLLHRLCHTAIDKSSIIQSKTIERRYWIFSIPRELLPFSSQLVSNRGEAPTAFSFSFLGFDLAHGICRGTAAYSFRCHLEQLPLVIALWKVSFLRQTWTFLLY